jgi:hypothetical protein
MKPEEILDKGICYLYIFILCSEVHYSLLLECFENHQPIYSDESLLFYRVDTKEIEAIQSILDIYQSKSGQLINQDKSEVSCD